MSQANTGDSQRETSEAKAWQWSRISLPPPPASPHTTIPVLPWQPLPAVQCPGLTLEIHTRKPVIRMKTRHWSRTLLPPKVCYLGNLFQLCCLPGWHLRFPPGNQWGEGLSLVQDLTSTHQPRYATLVTSSSCAVSRADIGFTQGNQWCEGSTLVQDLTPTPTPGMLPWQPLLAVRCPGLTLEIHTRKPVRWRLDTGLGSLSHPHHPPPTPPSQVLPWQPLPTVLCPGLTLEIHTRKPVIRSEGSTMIQNLTPTPGMLPWQPLPAVLCPRLTLEIHTRKPVRWKLDTGPESHSHSWYVTLATSSSCAVSRLTLENHTRKPARCRLNTGPGSHSHPQPWQPLPAVLCPGWHWKVTPGNQRGAGLTLFQDLTPTPHSWYVTLATSSGCAVSWADIGFTPGNQRGAGSTLVQDLTPTPTPGMLPWQPLPAVLCPCLTLEIHNGKPVQWRLDTGPGSHINSEQPKSWRIKEKVISCTLLIYI